MKESRNINIEVLKKAHARLRNFMENKESEQEQAGIVQAFEYCYELSWKIMRKVLYNEGIKVNSPKETFREAGRSEIIEKVKLWFDFLEKRNLTVHTYNEVVLKEIMKIVPKFENELNRLVKILEEKVSYIKNNK